MTDERIRGGAAPGRARAGGAPDYLIVAPVACRPLTATTFAVESAFAEHLRLLRRMYAERFGRLVLAAPVMDAGLYAERRGYLAEIDSAAEGIAFEPMHPKGAGAARYWLRHLVPNVRKLRRAVARAGLVHSGPSHLYRPLEILAIRMAVRRGIPTIFVQDVDERRSARMNYETGRWSLKSYLLARFVYDPFTSAQMRYAARRCSLVLFKGRKLCDDYGRGNPLVRNIIDSAFSADHVIAPDALDRKLARLADPARPLEAVYFGRLTGYKGVALSIEAVAKVVRERGAVVRFHVIGTGEEEEALRSLAQRLGAAGHVVFHGAVAFGPALFARLSECDLLLATPLSEDTPRNALDAMASGIPILAFDTYYYADLQQSGAVDVVPWPSADAVATRLAELCADKASLAPRARAGVEFARGNTQEIWLERRRRWTIEILDAAAGAGTEDACR